ncbi:Transmembrane 4 L6 family member 5 [Camelus dromedarius]|uniref:Transmembrane 4 L6 family member 5 n=1 Tax=Camelus dromedarius TaxID=9838 RepID=A0A5N4D5C5_CAMDR|nr:Transmembrane 4 L6 family member 5 [Camelus dromedarius]
MCTGKCARFVGLSLVSLSLICITANALLLVPTRTTWTKDHISLQVWLMAGFIGGGLMILCPGIAAVRHGGKAVVVQLLWKSLQCSRIPFQSVASPERLVGAPPGRRQEEE